jgi:hypothetical protein
MYSHLPYFLHITAMLCCSEEEEYFDEDFFLPCETPGHPPVARWCPFRCLVHSRLVIIICNKIRYNKVIGFCVYILAVCMTTRFWAYIQWASCFGLKIRCDRSGTRAVLTIGRKPRVGWTLLRTYSFILSLFHWFYLNCYLILSYFQILDGSYSSHNPEEHWT